VVLRLFKKQAETEVHMRVDRAIYNDSGKLEVRVIEEDYFKWRTFLKSKDYQTFTMSNE